MIHFVVALLAEAEPLIERYNMERTEVGFRSEQECLVVTGIGKRAAATATAALHEKDGKPEDDVWLNVGIAGHRHRAPGTLVLAHRILDEATGECFEPALPDGVELDRAQVTTVETAETHFLTPHVYDMEAAGFFRTARRFATRRHVQCLKIISDNRDTGTNGLTRASVSALVARHLESIDAFVAHLRSIPILPGQQGSAAQSL